MTISPSNLMHNLSDTQTPGRKRIASGDVMEKTVERRQKRMIKNRESAARSRARKQAYTHELENIISRLEEENERLKRQKINMEVHLDIEKIPILKHFISHLTQVMHSSVPGSLIIWYDSVTIDGSFSWQNQLNDNNKPFFDICDGIFMNYSWAEDYPRSSAAVAGNRKFDVYIGIDVFGRGTYGGGQWTTNVALDVLKKDDVSAAVFAPGWVYETKQPPDFQTAQDRVMVIIYLLMEDKYQMHLGTIFQFKAFRITLFCNQFPIFCLYEERF